MKKLIILIEILIIIILLQMSFKVEFPIIIGEAESSKVSDVIYTKKPKPKKYFLMTATGYYPGEECCGKWADGLTYTEDKAGKGCIAIDPNAGILKFGQKVFVEGYGEGICNDIGGKIKGWKIDLCFDSLVEAKEYGRQLVKVYVLD